ncbi:polysaccharide pyruvyl transferase family protein [Cyclobacterium sediminis]
MERRNALKNIGVLSSGMLITGIINALGKSSSVNSTKTILLVSGWQDVNIGDIAHTPGLIHVLKTFLPDYKIILWKKSRGEKVKALLKKNFPDVKIIYGSVAKDGTVEEKEVLNAINTADIMIHGSGPSVVGQDCLEVWMKYTSKPFGIFGTTIQSISLSLKRVLNASHFIFTRETASLQVLEQHGLSGNLISFAPDATFFFNLRDEKKGLSFLEEHHLKEKEFICVIPRLRYTPYHKIKKVDWSAEKIREVETTNEKYKEVDHGKLRMAMIEWVRQTGKKVLVCPEMTYQVDIMDELLIDPLPGDVKAKVIKREYWLPDEAASIYARAHSVLSFECHSPIIAAANGTPMFYLRQPEDTIKGQMYYDLGLADWVFEIEESEGEQIASKLMEIWKDYKGAECKLAEAMDKVDTIYKVASKQIETVTI